MPSHTPIYTHRTSKFPAATWGAFYVVSRKQSKSAANKRNCCNKPRFLLLYSHLPWIFAAWETVTEYLLTSHVPPLGRSHSPWSRCWLPLFHHPIESLHPPFRRTQRWPDRCA